MFNSVKKSAAYVLALGVLALGGSALANAATSSSATATRPTGVRVQAPPNFPAHGTPTHEDAEKTVTGESAAKARAAAIKSLGGGTAGVVTTDYGGRGFEVTVMKSDGTRVEVHLDSAYGAIQGPGGPGGPCQGRPGAPPPSGSLGAPPPANS